PALPNGIRASGTIFAPSVDTGQTLFACLGGGKSVYRSLDFGKTWEAGIPLNGNCKGLAVPANQSSTTKPDTSVVVHTTPAPQKQHVAGSNPLEVTIVNHSTGAKPLPLGFSSVADNGSGRAGVWTVPRSSGTGSAYDVFVADGLNFYVYQG